MNTDGEILWKIWFDWKKPIKGDLVSLSIVCKYFHALAKPIIERVLNFAVSNSLPKLRIYCPKSYEIKLDKFIYDASKYNLMPTQSTYIEELVGSYTSIVKAAKGDGLSAAIRAVTIDMPLSCITKIHFGPLFNLPVDELPSTVKILKLGLHFNQPIDHLPDIEELVLQSNFNYPLDNLPRSLLQLYFTVNSNFDHYLDHLPPNLIKLELYNDFEGLGFALPLDHLPNSLLHFRIDRNFEFPLDYLPPNLQTLDLSLVQFYDQPLDNLPESLLRLSMNVRYLHCLNNLPPSLISLHIIEPCWCNEKCVKPQKWKIVPDVVPPINHIDRDEFNNPYQHELDHLPESLQTLVLQNGCAYPLRYLPESLNSLYCNIIKEEDYLPQSLSELHVWNQPENDTLLEDLPPSLVVVKHHRTPTEVADSVGIFMKLIGYFVVIFVIFLAVIVV